MKPIGETEGSKLLFEWDSAAIKKLHDEQWQSLAFKFVSTNERDGAEVLLCACIPSAYLGQCIPGEFMENAGIRIEKVKVGKC